MSLAMNFLKISAFASSSVSGVQFYCEQPFCCWMRIIMINQCSTLFSSSIMLQMYCTRPNFNFPFPRKPISMPRKFRSFPRATTRIGKYPSILSKTLVTTDILTCDRMLSLTYHLMVHCLPLMILLVTHLSYGLSLKPSLRRISVYKVYNNNVDSIIPYNAARMSTYKTFF